MGERLYCIANHITTRYMCSICNVKPVRFFHEEYRYKKYCSNKCCSKDPKILDKISIGVSRALKNKTQEECDKSNEQRKATRKKNSGYEYSVGTPTSKINSKIEVTKRVYRSFLNDPTCQPMFSQQEYLDKKLEEYFAGNGTQDSQYEWLWKCSTCGYVYYAKLHREYHSKCPKCASKYSVKSREETKIVNYIKTIYTGPIIENSKQIIKPYELDIYLSELKLAFEFNGLYWHVVSRKDNIKGDPMYHLNKTHLCEQQGIHLVHIWEDLIDKLDFEEWIKTIVQNTLKPEINETTKLIELDHSIFPIWTNIPGYKFDHETSPHLNKRSIFRKELRTYDIYDCGKLVYYKI